MEQIDTYALGADGEWHLMQTTIYDEPISDDMERQLRNQLRDRVGSEVRIHRTDWGDEEPPDLAIMREIARCADAVGER